MAAPQTFDELCEIEPGLLDLEADMRAVEDDGQGSFFCSNYVWLPFNARLKSLIGVARPGVSSAEPDDVRYSSHAYEVAYRHLTHFLPPCRGCGCEQYRPILERQLREGEGQRAEAADEGVGESSAAAVDPPPALPSESTAPDEASPAPRPIGDSAPPA